MTKPAKIGGALVLALLTTLAPATAARAGATPGTASRTVDGPPPIVIGHRGAAGYRPEHTVESYRTAIAMGADYIEPDLVSTKDGILVARHENEIGTTTDVAEHPEFADRRTTKLIDGKPVTGWFTEDFTLHELKSLRAVERLPDVRPGNTAYDGKFEVPTFDEVLTLVQQQERLRHRRIGVYPETKHPTYFRSIGLPLEQRAVEVLHRHGLDRAGSKVFLQSFEPSSLRRLDQLTDLPTIQLIDSTGAPYDFISRGDTRTYATLTRPSQLRRIATYAAGIGPNKDLVLPRDAAGNTTTPSHLVRDAHRAGLVVHIFTLRRENQFMAKNFWIGTDPDGVGDFEAEAHAFFDAGIDGAFTDNPDLLVRARRDWRPAQQPAA